jgi:hypothetical protein
VPELLHDHAIEVTLLREVEELSDTLWRTLTVIVAQHREHFYLLDKIGSVVDHHLELHSYLNLLILAYALPYLGK